MSITVPGVPSNLLVPGVYANLDYTRALASLARSLSKTLLIGQRLAAYVTPARWQGETLHDCAAGGTYTGATVKEIILKISTAGATDKFQYSVDNGATWSVETDCATSPVALEDGITAVFGAITGHALNDQWNFEAFPGGTVAKETPKQISDSRQAAEQTGYGSMLHRMAIAATGANELLDLNYVALEDNGSNKAAGDFTLGGSANSSGEEVFHIGDARISVPVTKGDTPAELAIDLQNGIAGLQKNLAAVAGVDITTLEKVTLTAKNAGTLGNTLKLSHEPGGTGITVTVTGLAAGSGDPSLTAALAAVAGGDYYYYVNPYLSATALSALKTQSDDLSGPLKIRPFLYITAETTDFNNALTEAAANIHGRSVILAVEGIKRPPYEYAAAAVSELTLFSDPAQPVNGAPLRNMDLPDEAGKFSFTEQQNMLAGGVTPLVVNRQGYLSILRLVSTSNDPAFREINTTRTGDYVRADYTALIDSRYGQAKNTPRILREILTDLKVRSLAHEAAEILQPGSTEANDAQFQYAKAAGDPNRIDFSFPIYPVGAAHVKALNIGIKLS